MGRPRYLSWRADAVIVSLEDVLLEFSAARRATWGWWAARVGHDADLIAEAAQGRHAEEVIREFAPDRDVTRELAAVVERESILLRTARRGRGAGALIRQLPSERWAAVSCGTPEELAIRWTRTRLPEPGPLISAADVSWGPPDPESRLAAAVALGTVPERCIALEGSPAGVAAAAAAGAAAIMVQPGIERDVPPAAQAVVHSLSALRVQLVQDDITITIRTESPRGW